MCLDKQLIQSSCVALRSLSHLLCYLSVRGALDLFSLGLFPLQELCEPRGGEAPDDVFEPGAHPEHLDESTVFCVYTDLPPVLTQPVRWHESGNVQPLFTRGARDGTACFLNKGHVWGGEAVCGSVDNVRERAVPFSPFSLDATYQLFENFSGRIILLAQQKSPLLSSCGFRFQVFAEPPIAQHVVGRGEEETAEFVLCARGVGHGDVDCPWTGSTPLQKEKLFCLPWCSSLGGFRLLDVQGCTVARILFTPPPS